MEQDNAQNNEQVLISDYFTAEVEEKIREMTDAEMLSELTKFEESRAWIALLRYVRLRTSMIQNVLFIEDPIVNPTKIARSQGIMIGLTDVQDAIIVEKQRRDEEAKEAKKKE